MFSLVSILTDIATYRGGEFPFLHGLYRLDCCSFQRGHSDQCEVIPHCTFDLPFSSCDSWGRKQSDTTEQLNWTEELVMLSIISSAFLSSLWLPRRIVHLFFGWFFYWLVCFLMLSCASGLYVLKRNSLLGIFVCKEFFFHSEGYLFLSLMVSFAVQMLLMFIRSRLFIFALFSWFYEVDQKRTCCIWCQGVCSFPQEFHSICPFI